MSFVKKGCKGNEFVQEDKRHETLNDYLMDVSNDLNETHVNGGSTDRVIADSATSSENEARVVASPVNIPLLCLSVPHPQHHRSKS
jgi:hypothetical protein